MIPVTLRARIGACCPAAIEYSSTNTDCAVPATMAAAPEPTRTTAKLNGLKGYGVLEGVRDGVVVLVGVTADDAVLVCVRAPVRVLLGVDAGVCEVDPEADPVGVLEGVAVDVRGVGGVPVGTLVRVDVPVDAPVDDGDAVVDDELV